VLELSFDSWGVALNWFEIGPAVVAGNNAPVITTAEPVTLVCTAAGSGTKQLAAVDTDGDTLRWSIATPPEFGTAMVSASGLLSYVAPHNFGAGRYCVVRVEDGRGGADSIRVDLDVSAVNGGPVATLDALAGLLVAGDSVVLTATASDPDGAVASVKYYVDGTALGSGANASAGWGVLWTPPAAGTFALTCEATDNKGRVGARSAVVTVNVIARGAALVVTDECGTIAPPERVAVDGLAAEDGVGNQPYGDGTKLVPVGTTQAGTVTWHVPDATAVWFSHALTDSQPGTLVVEASPDGIAFTAVTTFAQRIGSADTWSVYDGAAALPVGTNFVRIKLGAVGASWNWNAARLWLQIDSVPGGGAATPVPLPGDFKVTPAAVAGQSGQFQVVFGPVQGGYTYTPEFCTDLGTGNWVRLTAFTQSDNGSQRTITDLSATGARRFYRIRVTPAP
jgi:hypothetical protein